MTPAAGFDVVTLAQLIAEKKGEVRFCADLAAGLRETGDLDAAIAGADEALGLARQQLTELEAHQAAVTQR